MKRNEIIELNGKEYTLELNRQSALKIEQRTNDKEIQKISKELLKEPFEYIEKIDLNEDPFADEIDVNSMVDNTIALEKALRYKICVAFYIWLYPNHKLNIEQVQELLKPYFEDEEKIAYISKEYTKFEKLSSEISERYIQELKNLKAQANK